MQLATYLTALQRAEKSLADGFTAVAAAHDDEPEIAGTAPLLASWSYEHVDRLETALAAFGKKPPLDAKLLAGSLFAGPRGGPVGLLNDLLELAMLAGEAQLLWALAGQGARVLRADHLLELCQTLPVQTDRQKIWLETQLKAISPQILVAS
jgi:glyoxylase-like metal-dependent hydrolase (beta-lactamase superfamily II)